MPNTYNTHHSRTVIADSGTVFTPATSTTTSVFETVPISDGIGQLYLGATASAAVSLTTDAIYILGHDTIDSPGIRLKTDPSDTEPFNLLTGWDGDTAIADIIPFRLPRFMSVEFVSSDSGVTFTLTRDLTVTSPSAP